MEIKWKIRRNEKNEGKENEMGNEETKALERLEGISGGLKCLRLCGHPVRLVVLKESSKLRGAFWSWKEAFNLESEFENGFCCVLLLETLFFVERFSICFCFLFSQSVKS